MLCSLKYLFAGAAARVGRIQDRDTRPNAGAQDWTGMSITFTLLFLFSFSIDCSLAYKVLSSTVRLRCAKVYNGQNVYPAYADVLIIMHQMKILLWKNLHFPSQQGDRILSFSFFSSRYAGDHLLAPRPSLGSKKRVNRSQSKSFNVLNYIN